MNFSLKPNRLYHYLGRTAFLLLFLLLLLEGWRYGVKPSTSNRQATVEQSLDSAVRLFTERQQNLLNRTETLAINLELLLMREQSFSRLYSMIERFPDFWSVTLLEDGEPIVWNRFARQTHISSSGDNEQTDPSIQIQRRNNVLLLECTFPFSVQDSSSSTSYKLFTSYRIEQSNPLPIGKEAEYNMFVSSQTSSQYPVQFSIYSSVPSNFLQQRTLETLAGDSVGMVYATADTFDQTYEEWESDTRFWRSIFALVSFIFLAALLFAVADYYGQWQSLLLQIIPIGIGWGIFIITDFHHTWAVSLLPENAGPDLISTAKTLSNFALNSLFALMIAVTFARKLVNRIKELGSTSYFSTIGITVLIGLLNTLLLLFVISESYQGAVESQIAFLDLQIFPSWNTFIFYLSLGTFLLALVVLLTALNRFLFKYARHQRQLSAAILFTAFLLTLFIAQLFVPDWMVLNWIFYLSIGIFAVIFGLSLIYETYGDIIDATSYLRRIVVTSFILALFGLPVLYQTYLANMEAQLWDKANEYSKVEDSLAEDLTEKILNSLEQEFRGISQVALQDSQSAIQSRFTQSFRGLLEPHWQTYSFDLQLIKPNGDLVADYSTDLNSPNWVNVHDVSRLSVATEMEQINRSSVRPIVQLPQLINQEDYRIFYRGWIPIFGPTGENPVAWILCSVYQERPKFDKPIRAVMASLNENWTNSYLMQEFQDGQALRTALHGFENHFPKYQQLQPHLSNALENDTLTYITEIEANYIYRTLLWEKADNNIIKTSTTIADPRIILFSYFRFGFTLLLAGCFLILMVKLIKWKDFYLMGRNNKFKDRILDSFLLAILIFLGLLIIASHYAIKQQNTDIVRQELFDKLERLTNSAENSRGTDTGSGSNTDFALDLITTQLNVDATYYEDIWMTESTTPQIYQQYLLPSAIPFTVYSELFNEHKRETTSAVNLAGQQLLIGFRSILNPENEPVATIAIPTFLNSPKYEQQLLDTTSYLILIYLFVFGLFILASTLISNQLARPLAFIQRGLNKISEGNLNTTIPVKSDDEIGNLARAYNQMVFRLKQLQTELAKAEREAAWKEMAQQVAHEIKNPLTPMKLNVQHLERQLASTDYNPEELKARIKEIISNIIEQIQSLNSIASDFSKFAQPVEEEFSTVNLNRLLKSVSDLYQHDEDVKIINNLPRNEITVQGAEDELKRVIINMVKNAYEAIPEEGKIVLRLFQKQQHAFIEIEDTGSGIREEDKPNIFVPSFSTKSSGTGLGLAICKKVVEAHHGSISFASVEGEGTTFIIKLPLNNT